MPPCYDQELARILRVACLALDAAMPRGAKPFPVLAGPTLAAWYHLGSQAPWKRHVHLAVAVAGWRAADCPSPKGEGQSGGEPAHPAEDLARTLTRHLRRAGLDVAEVTLRRTGIALRSPSSGNPADAVGPPRRPSNAHQVSAEWLVRSPKATAHRPDVRLIAHLETSPLPADRLPALAKLARVAIDGANTAVYVPGGRAEVAAAVREWAAAEARAEGRSEAVVKKRAADASTKLELPPGWAWSTEELAFVRPTWTSRALQWPPSATTVKAALLLAVLLGAAYLATMIVLPEWGAAVAARRFRRRVCGSGVPPSGEHGVLPSPAGTAKEERVTLSAAKGSFSSPT
jgi:hypothetical protein